MNSQIVGHEQIIARLEDAHKQDKISHAYLFEGTKGIGRFTTAMHFVRTVLCKSMGDKPCGQCASCRKIAGSNHEHVYSIEPDGNSIKDAQVEAIQELVSKKPYDDDRTFIIIDGMDTMTARAQNRILKTLEEPPEKVTFILLVENAQSIAITILSRCVSIKFKPVDRKKIMSFLSDKGVDPSRAEIIAALSYGLPGKGLDFLTSEGVDEKRKTVIKVAFSMLNDQPYYLFSADLMELSTSKDEALEVLNILEGIFRDVLVCKVTDKKDLIVNLDYYAQMLSTAPKVRQSKIARLIEAVEVAKNDIAMNINVGYSMKNAVLSGGIK